MLDYAHTMVIYVKYLEFCSNIVVHLWGYFVTQGYNDAYWHSANDKESEGFLYMTSFQPFRDARSIVHFGHILIRGLATGRRNTVVLVSMVGRRKRPARGTTRRKG